MYIDSHSHLYSEEFDKDIDEVVQRALEANVNHIILPDIDSTSRTRMLDLVERYPKTMYPLLGLHPTSINNDYKDELLLLEKVLAKHTFYGIGETGIDLYWDKTYYKEQIKAFEYQLSLAKELNLPVIVHSRDSMELVLEIISKHSHVRGLLHCFPGNTEDALRAIDMGYFIGVGGIVTYKNSEIRKVVENIGCKNIVLETDAPYLAPIPKRGKRNESSYIPYIAEYISNITNTDLKEIARITTKNAVNLFNIAL